ncbi:hypothetical protein HU200_066362 [Digitaria exilis]|uniref:Uncharacterized protein n=1 Tax=Digitaria exilis TaxID=1010633 RepID=A0A834ZYB3_9POAL|nr:hypothetical protein HU200_066362 [Digitaria exilis]
MERAIVSAATGVMSSVLGKLADLLREEYKLAKGVRKDMEFLRSELSAMNDLLFVLAEVEVLDAINKGWRDRVRELAYDIEDCIDRSVARLDGAAGRRLGGAKLVRRIKKIRVSLQVAHQIQELKARAVEESKRQKRYKLDGLAGASPNTSKVDDLRMCALWEETEKLIKNNAAAHMHSFSLFTYSFIKLETHICGRYIVVVDDIWHSDPWKIIGQALVKTSPGSIIIITTRLKDVAQSCCSSHGGCVYDIKPLDEDNSKRLFFKRIFDSEAKCPHELESASKDILKKCNGIPLAIISISSFLAVDVPQSPDHWNKVKESISSPLPGNKSVETMKSVLSLSYFNLPHHLRTCLLYLSAFPEDCEIERDRLVCRWVAEGFVNPEPGESLYEAGLRYFNVLVNRSLIQPWKKKDGVVLSCRVHDVILSFLASKSFEENFITFLEPSGVPHSVHSKVRRLSLQNSYQENVLPWIKLIKPHVRSLACFVDCKEVHPLTEFEVVRVLDLESCGSLRNIHLENIEMLLQLRYLSIRRTSVSELPAGIGQVQHLETLDIRGTKVKQLPSTIVLLEKLARLFVGWKVKFPAEGISRMEGLEQLTCLSIHGQPLSFLKELGQHRNLRILQASWEGWGDLNYYEGSEWRIFTSSLQRLGNHKLHSLDFKMKMYEGEFPIPMDSSFPAAPPSLRTFSISPISSLPIWMGSLANLELLHLCTVRFTPEDVQVLGSMPALETLALEITGDYAGPFTVGSGAFQRLKSFQVDRLCQLLFMPGSMPNLRHLNATLNYTFGSIRDLGIQHLASLTKVSISIYAWRDHNVGVLCLKLKIQSFLDAHPNRPTLDFTTYLTERDVSLLTFSSWEQNE